MSEVRRVLLANGQYIEIVQETGTSTGSVMSQNAVTTALNGKANTTHTHAASDITSGTFGSARIADGAITKAKLASDVPISVIQYETVTVTGVCSDGSSIAGKQLSIGGSLYEFDGNGVVSANIPYGQTYTIKPIASNLYFSNDFYAFTASTANRSVTMNYSWFNYGVYIEDLNGRLFDSKAWSAATHANANAVVVMSNTKSFRIALQGAPSFMLMSAEDTESWGTYLSGTTNSTGALRDYNGAVNTQLIVTKYQPSTKYAAGWCNAYTFPDGVTKGYLPSSGELYLAYQNKAAVDAALVKCGGTVLSTDYLHWSSTFFGVSGGYSYFWGFRWNDGEVFKHTLSFNYNVVRAFGAH